MHGLRMCASCFALAAALAAPAALHAADYRVPAGTSDATPKVLTGNDTLTVDPNALLTSPTDPTVNQVGVATNVIVTNGGRIEAPNGRAFDTSGSGTPRTITVNNVANAVIVGNNDALRINSDIGAGVVIINNLGTIASQTGQGIDFDAVGPGANLTINNFSGGVIQAAADDAVRPGTATLNNAGTIRSDGVAGSASDAVDTQGRVASISNFDGGVISGLRHGIAANGAVTVGNSTAGSIVGRNGAGISAGGLATITNFGAIAGATDGVAGGSLAVQNAAGGAIVGNAGTGVTATGGGTLTNFGAIGGATDGVRAGGALTVGNAAGATIVGRGGGGVISTGSVALTNEGQVGGGTVGVSAGSTVNVSNAAAGQIRGASGAGIVAVGDGTVVNAGAISGGAAAGVVAANGDGVRIGGIATITNFGTIQGTGSAGATAGRANTSEGVDVGGGTVNNAAAAQIVGANNGIVADDGQGGAARGATVVNNDGTIRGANGAGISFTGAFNDSVNNSGTIVGVNGPAISLGAGNDTLTLLTSSNIQGAIDGGDGSDAIVLSGGAVGSTGTLGPTTNFETLSIQAATWIVTGTSTYSGGITVNGARLDNRGTLLGATSVVSGEIVNGGSFGALSLTGANTDIRPGGTGATGTITVNGNYAQSGQAIYFADLTAAGASDRIVAGGTASLQSNAILALTRAPGTYTVGTRYTLLTAAGGLTGTFGTVAGDSDPLTILRVNYGTNAVTVDVLRSAASIGLAAGTPNQVEVARALGTIDINSPLFGVVGGIVSTPTLTAVLDALSGEVYSSTHAALSQDARRVANVIATRFETAAPRSGGWLQGIVASGRADGANGAVGVKQRAYGAVGGVDIFTVDRMRGGLALGYTHDKIEVGGRGSRLDSDAFQAALYGGGSFGRLHFKLVGGYTWVKLDTTRNVALPTPETVRASYDGSVQFALGELSYAVPLGGFSLSPFVMGQATHVSNDGATETGGISALRIAPGGEDISTVTGGLRVAGPESGAVTLRGSLGFRRIFGTSRPRTTLAFLTGATFSTFGASLPRNAGVGDVDLLYRVGERARVGIGYSGVVGSGGNDHAARVIFAVGL